MAVGEAASRNRPEMRCSLEDMRKCLESQGSEAPWRLEVNQKQWRLTTADQTVTLTASHVTVVFRQIQPHSAPRPSPLHPCFLDLHRYSPYPQSPLPILQLAPVVPLHFRFQSHSNDTEAWIETSIDHEKYQMSLKADHWVADLTCTFSELDHLTYSLTYIRPTGLVTESGVVEVGLASLAQAAVQSGSWKVRVSVV